MPEGDTIFRTARNIGRALVGKPVIGFRSTFPLLTRFNDDTPLVGQTVDQVEARGKWLLIHFSGGGILTSHLLMNGRWHIYRHGERWQAPRVNMRIVIENSEYQAVGFRVPVARMHTEQSLARDLHVARPENDLLSEEFDAAAASGAPACPFARSPRRRAARSSCARGYRQRLQVGDLLRPGNASIPRRGDPDAR